MIKLKPVLQSSSMCGPASLASLLDFYGYHTSEEELVKICNATEEFGTEPGDLVRGAESLGFRVVAKAEGTWEDLERLVQEGTPVLVNWWSDYEEPYDGHYSVVSEMSDTHITLMDPEIGADRRIEKEKFLNKWYDFYRDGRTNYRWYMYIVK
ncbi:C39 family peptidase [Candidatus Parcubacteria bacterium]|nr:C39 family peptidase [Candidatus Parcubacteria bacterium]